LGDIDVSAVGDRKLKVFISYSRKDEDFAQDLLAGLQIAGFEPYLDKHDIAAGENWEARLGRLIEAADTVVFVISPDAVASERCAWEVERTVTLKKRLPPIVLHRVDEAQVPPRLKQLNYIFFYRPFSFGASLQALGIALRTDLEWIREHTRIGEMALRWDARGRAEALLLRGEELAVAKTWLASPPQYAPEPTLLHHEFIKAAEDAETVRSSAERQRA
jgi:TIR domain